MEQATAQSKALIRLFKKMKDYIIDEIRQDVSIMKTDLQKVMTNFIDPIMIVDNYMDIKTLDLLRCVAKG